MATGDGDGEELQRKSPMAAFKDLAAGKGPPLRVLYLAMIIEFASFAMIIVILPFFLMHELKLDASSVGGLLSSFSAAQLIGAWISGRISDATGRYPVITAVFAWAGIGLGLTSLVQNWWQILFVRFAQGLSGGTAALCDAYVLDLTTEQNRATYIGLTGAVKGVGFMFGPAISISLTHLGVPRRTIFLLAGFGALTSAVLCFLFLGESLPKDKRRALVENGDGEKACCDSDFHELDAVNKGLSCVWFCRFASAMGLGFLYSTYAFLIHDNFGWGDAEFGMVLLFSGIASALLQFLVFPHLSSSFGTSRVLCAGCLCGAIAYTFIAYKSVMIHLVALVFFMTSGGCIEPSLPVLIGDFVQQQYLGFANGGTTSFRALATVLTPLVAGHLYEISRWHTYYSGALCFAVAAMGTIPILFASDEDKPLLPRQDKLTKDVDSGTKC